MGVSKEGVLGVDTGVVIFFVVGLEVGTLFKVVILVWVRVNDGAMICVLSYGEDGCEEEGPFFHICFLRSFRPNRFL